MTYMKPCQISMVKPSGNVVDGITDGRQVAQNVAKHFGAACSNQSDRVKLHLRDVRPFVTSRSDVDTA